MVKAPKGSKIAVTCRRGCPRSKVARTARNVKLTSMRGTYRAGAILEIKVTKSKMIGKYKIQIMKGKVPKRQDLCLWPTSKKPKKCPAGTSPGH